MEDMDQMVKMLANAPEEQRRVMVKQRMDMFLSMPEDNRIQGMKGMLASIGKLNAEEKRRLIKTRTEVVASYPEEQRKTLLVSRVKAGMQLPRDVDAADMSTIQAVLPELPENLRSNFMATQQALMKSMGISTPAPAPASRGGVPVHHDRPMELRGFFQKRYECSVCGHTQPT